MQRILLLSAIALMICSSLFSQKIVGSVKDETSTPIGGATVFLKKTSDSTVLKMNATNLNGNFEFADLAKGNYFLVATHVGFKQAFSQLIKVDDQSSHITANLVITKRVGELKSVVVTGQKPVIEVLADKTVVNVEGTINAIGQDALELLRKSPGITIDKDDNISLSGKNGVRIYVDGKEIPLAGADLAAYLKNLQSPTIESLELITHPSAKYEAAGNAGIINIRLKKNKALGTNGSWNGGYAQAVYAKYNTGLVFNNRNRKMNIFATLNFNRAENENHMRLYRKQLDTLFDQRTNMKMNSRGNTFKGGVDFFINSKSIVGFLVNGSSSKSGFANNSRTPIKYIPTSIVDRILEARNNSDMSRKNVNFNVNYKYADKTGRELNMDADYGYYNLFSDQMQRNYYFTPSNDPLNQKIYNFYAPANIDIYSFKTDYSQKFHKGILSLGEKVSYVQTDNVFNRYDVESSVKNYDSTRSNRFDYREQINAVYATYARQMKKVNFQFGVRVENTISTGISNGFKYNGTYYAANKSDFKRRYTDLFPSAGITFTGNPKHQWGLRISRRIDRPAYQDLNPFEFKLDEYTFQKGNTNLRPQYTHTAGLTYTYKYKLNTSLNYSHVNDVFTQIVDTTEKSKAFLTKKNLAKQDVVALNISYPFQKKSYSMFTNFNSNYSHYQADLGVGRRVDLDVFAFSIYQQHSLKFAKTFTAELDGFYNSPTIWQGTFRSKKMWSINIGLMKTILKGNGNVKIGVSDIFKSLKWAGTSDFAGQHINANGAWESRLFKLNLTYRFGSNQVKAARQRKTSLEEESQRVQQSQGGIGNN